MLADITVNGRAVKAVAMPSKQAFLYVFDRVTGQPVWPIEERPMPKCDVPGECYPPTQPIPTKPPAYSRNYLTVPDDRSTSRRSCARKAIENLKRYKVGPVGMPYNPPIVGTVNGLLGAINIGNLGGGTNWPGGGYDPENHTVYVQAANAGIGGTSVVAPPAGFSDIRYVMGVTGRRSRFPRTGIRQRCRRASARRRKRPPPRMRSRRRICWRIDGLPIMKPPYGVLAAINLDRGDLVWQVPHGETPDAVRNHPALQRARTFRKPDRASAWGWR